MKVKTAKTSKNMVPVQVYLPDKTYLELKSTAAARGVTMSSVARERFEVRLKQLEPKRPAKQEG